MILPGWLLLRRVAVWYVDCYAAWLLRWRRQGEWNPMRIVPDDERRIWIGWQGGRVFAVRLAFSAAVWWILSGGVVASWLVGVPACTAAAYASACMLRPLRWTLRGAARYWSFFLVESLRGGLDVAIRALHWRMPLDPGVFEHPFRVSFSGDQVAVTNTISLLPGSLAADIDQGRLYVHALDKGANVPENLRLSEERVAALFGLRLERPEVDEAWEEP